MLKRIALSTTALTFFLLGASPAAADPISAIAGIIGAIASGAGVAQIVLGLALSVGSTLLQMALAPDAPKLPAVGVKLQVEVGDDKAVSTTIGRTATRGRRKYIGSYGDQDGTPNSHLTEVIELGNLPVSGLNGIWIDDEKCTILWDEPVSRGYPIEEYRVEDDGETTDYAWIRFHDGTQTQADSYLIGKFGDHDKRPWTAAMVGRGVPYAVMTYRYNRELFRGQPSCLFEMAPIPLYDIRKDSTNGGNGAHRWSDTETWEPSENLAVMTYNVIRGLKYKNEWFYGGQDVAEHRLPSSSWIAAAQECGRLIDNADGSREPQFRGGLEIAGDILPIEVVEEFRKAMGGRLADTAGTIKPKVGPFGAAVFAFTDDDVLVTSPQQFDPFPALDQTVNAINAAYPEPGEAWTSKDAPALRDSELEERDGKRLPADMAFRAAPHKRQVQRLMRAALKEERRFRKHRLTLPPAAYALEPGIDVVSWTSAHNGYVNKRFLVVEIEGEATMNQVVTLQEIDPSDYDWSSDFELPTAVGWLGRIDAPIQIMQGWAVDAATVTDATGLARRPAIRVSCAPNLDDVKRVWVKVRVKATGAVVFDSDHNAYGAPFNWLVTGNWCLPATQYQVSGKLVPYSARKTAWSSWLDVTTDDIRFSLADLHYLELIKEVTADLVVFNEWLYENTRNVIERQKASAFSLIQQDFANFGDKQELRVELKSAYDKVTAEYSEVIVAATGPTSAIVGRLETIEAELPDLVHASAFDALLVEVNTHDGIIEAHGLAITEIDLELTGKASVTALNSLEATVVEQGSQIIASATAITSLTAAVGEVTADTKFRMEVVASPSGYARIGAQARVTTGEGYRAAAFYIDVPVDPGTPTQFVVEAGRFAVVSGSDKFQIFAVDGTGVYMDSAYLRTITTDKITFLDGSILTSALAQNAVVAVPYFAEVGSVTHSAGTTTIGSITVPKGANDLIVVLADVRLRTSATSGGSQTVTVELYAGTLLIGDAVKVFLEDADSETMSLQGTVVSGTGDQVITLRVSKSNAGDVLIGRRTITPMLFKKATVS